MVAAPPFEKSSMPPNSESPDMMETAASSSASDSSRDGPASSEESAPLSPKTTAAAAALTAEANATLSQNARETLESKLQPGSNDGRTKAITSRSSSNSDREPQLRRSTSPGKRRTNPSRKSHTTSNSEQQQPASSYQDLEARLGGGGGTTSTLHSSTALGGTTATTTTSSKRSKAGRATKNHYNKEVVKDGPPQVITTTTTTSTDASHPSLVTTAPIAAATKKQSTAPLRRGKWTVEEEAFVARVIQDFNSGYLKAPAGTTLRTYLSDKLQCDPMRITKKFTGEACIGKRVFHPAVRSPSNTEAIDRAQTELDALERRWRRRLEMQQRESAKKAAASAAAAAAATRPDGGGASSALGVTPAPATGAQGNPIVQTAAWLDRAKSSLRSTTATANHSNGSGGMATMQRTEIMSQMQQVERLLHEGPVMQQTSLDLAQRIAERPTTITTTTTTSASAEGPPSPPPEPADKRLRTGAEDAEALVGFLRSVRASAASGQDY